MTAENAEGAEGICFSLRPLHSLRLIPLSYFVHFSHQPSTVSYQSLLF